MPHNQGSKTEIIQDDHYCEIAQTTNKRPLFTYQLKGPVNRLSFCPEREVGAARPFRSWPCIWSSLWWSLPGPSVYIRTWRVRWGVGSGNKKSLQTPQTLCRLLKLRLIRIVGHTTRSLKKLPMFVSSPRHLSIWMENKQLSSLSNPRLVYRPVRRRIGRTCQPARDDGSTFNHSEERGHTCATQLFVYVSPRLESLWMAQDW